jgi:hypothetical protein
MGDEHKVAFRPRDLAIVWGTAFGQLSRIWTASIRALLEYGSAEAAIHGQLSDHVDVPATGGGAGSLRVGKMVGETFGETLRHQAVKVSGQKPIGHDLIRVYFRVDEALAHPVTGDIYRGSVLVQEKVVGQIGLDAGS